MINCYEEYMKQQKILSIEKMEDIHKRMINAIGNDAEAIDMYDELVSKATQYAAYRAEWFIWDRETRMERDDSRSSCHNSLIVKFNMLAKYLKMQGQDDSWREELGYEEDDKYNRKVVGDFACYIVFINSLNAR